MEQSPSLADIHLVKEIPRLLLNPKFHFRVLKCPLSRSCVTFRKKLSPYGEEFLALRQPSSWRSTSCRLSATAYSLYLQLPLHIWKSCDSSVGTALGYGLDDRGSRVRFRRGLGIFLFTTASRPALGPTQPPIQWVPGDLSLGVKWPGRETDHSPPPSAEVKEWVELYLHSPNKPSWRGAQLKESTGIHLPLLYLSLNIWRPTPPAATQGHAMPY
jgi:hypothetical protein